MVGGRGAVSERDVGFQEVLIVGVTTDMVVEGIDFLAALVEDIVFAEFGFLDVEEGVGCHAGVGVFQHLLLLLPYVIAAVASPDTIDIAAVLLLILHSGLCCDLLGLLGHALHDGLIAVVGDGHYLETVGLLAALQAGEVGGDVHLQSGNAIVVDAVGEVRVGTFLGLVVAVAFLEHEDFKFLVECGEPVGVEDVLTVNLHGNGDVTLVIPI